MKGLGLEGPVLFIAGKTVISRLELHVDGKPERDKRSATQSTGLGVNARPEEIDGGKTAARVRRPDDCGCRGGKVLDTARAVAADLDLPVVNCPTVASSDAPCSALSVIYSEEGVFQEYRFYRKNPDLVLVDTQVIAQAPPRLLAAGMGDALATWFEAKTCERGPYQTCGAVFDPQRLASPNCATRPLGRGSRQHFKR